MELENSRSSKRELVFLTPATSAPLQIPPEPARASAQRTQGFCPIRSPTHSARLPLRLWNLRRLTEAVGSCAHLLLQVDHLVPRVAGQV